MRADRADPAWLEDPKVFAVNRIPHHSDHRFYEKPEEAEKGGDMPLKQSLNGEWQFDWAPDPGKRQKDFYSMQFDNSGFSRIQVPGHIETQGFGRNQYVNSMYPWDGIEEIHPPEVPEKDHTVGSYVRYFTLQKNLRGKRVFLSFQGVETAFFVWINGNFIGYSEDSFAPAEFEVTEELMEGVNKLAVEVHQRSSASWIEDQDFFRFSGIFREVFLYAIPRAHVWDLFVKAGLKEDARTGLLSANARLEGVLGCSVRLLVRDREGRQILESRKKQKSGSNFRQRWRRCSPGAQKSPVCMTCFWRSWMKTAGSSRRHANGLAFAGLR